MISIKIEDMLEIKEELEPLFEAHWEEVAMYKELDLCPNWPVYEQLQKEDRLYCMAVRDEDVLVGYSIWVINPSLHYADHLFANNDLIFLDQAYRGTDIAEDLLYFSEDFFCDKGISIMTLHMKTYAAFEGLATNTGYDKMEYMYTKYMGE